MRVMITGAGSYLGSRIANCLTENGMAVETLDMRKAIPAKAFEGTDAVIHVAGIAHQRETQENEALYFQVNRDLAVETARAAKAQGVGQFVFFSSMSVYGMNSGHITAETAPAPRTAYGRSKWEAEQQLQALADERFKVAVLRPPMIYGKGCRGNYPRLRALALEMPFFPAVDNRRSMLYVGCLCGFVKRLVQSGLGGLYFPQNRDYVATDALVKAIADAHGKRLWLFPGLGTAIRRLSARSVLLEKVFGSLTYDQRMSEAFSDEPQPGFAETIILTEETE